MTAIDIVKIIKACRSFGVEKFNYEGMEIHFHPRDGERVKAVPGDTTPPPSDQELEDVEQQVRDVSAADAAEEELDHMRVENPALFEQLLVERAFEERGDGDEETND